MSHLPQGPRSHSLTSFRECWSHLQAAYAHMWHKLCVQGMRAPLTALSSRNVDAQHYWTIHRWPSLAGAGHRWIFNTLHRVTISSATLCHLPALGMFPLALLLLSALLLYLVNVPAAMLDSSLLPSVGGLTWSSSQAVPTVQFLTQRHACLRLRSPCSTQ